MGECIGEKVETRDCSKISTDYRDYGSVEAPDDSSFSNYKTYSTIGNHNGIDLVEIYQLPTFTCRTVNDNSSTSWNIH